MSLAYQVTASTFLSIGGLSSRLNPNSYTNSLFYIIEQSLERFVTSLSCRKTFFQNGCNLFHNFNQNLSSRMKKLMALRSLSNICSVMK